MEMGAKSSRAHVKASEGSGGDGAATVVNRRVGKTSTPTTPGVSLLFLVFETLGPRSECTQ